MDTKIKEVEQEIKRVQKKIDDVEASLTRAINEAERADLRKEKAQLRDMEMLLRKDKAQLRALEMLLAQAGVSEGGSSPKKRKWSPAVPTLDSETDVAGRSSDRSRYIEDLLAPPDNLPIEVADLLEFLSEKLRPLPVSLEIFLIVKDPKLVKASSPAELSVAEYVNFVCHAFRERPYNEADSSHKLRSVTGDFLLHQTLSPQLNRNWHP